MNNKNDKNKNKSLLNVENEAVKKFLKMVKEVLYDANTCLEEEKKLDVPLIMSTLYQNLSSKEYDVFVKDLDTKSHAIYYEEDRGGYTFGKIIININYKEINYKEYSYEILLGYDSRYNGYCQCTSDMEDYRVEKNCCGHGCDTIFSNFELRKIISLGESTWIGDEHDYWEFEDEFLGKNNDLYLQEEVNKKLKNVENEIELILNKFTTEIEELYEKLAELSDQLYDSWRED